MFSKGHELQGYQEVLPGVRRKTLAHGEKTLMVAFRLSQGAQIPNHSHPHEQTGYLVTGALELTLKDEVLPATAGDSWCIPGGTWHSVRATAESVVVEVFAPPREDYLPGSEG